MTKNIKYPQKHNILFAILILFSAFFFFSPHKAKAASNMQQNTASSMQATALDAILKNFGSITPGDVYLNPSASGGTNGTVGMYGVENGVSFNFFNSGSINLIQGSNSSYGMLAYTSNGSHLLENTGSIYSSSNGADDGRAYGMQARASNIGNHSIVNSGDIYVGTSGINSHAYAIEAYAGHNGSHNIINSGDIEAVSQGTNSHTYGMNAYSDSAGNHILHNSGIITAKVFGTNSNANGMDAATDDTGNHTVSNSGTIIAEAITTGTNTHATYANGINVFVKNNGNHTAINTGDIYVKAQGNSSRAYGIDVNSDVIGSHIVTNSGTIISFASGDLSRAYGMRSAAASAGDQTLINTGYISATNTFLIGATDSPAHGLVADNLGTGGTGNHTLINRGTINVESNNESSHAHAMRAYATTGNHYLQNYGKIFASASGNLSHAYGMYVQGSPNTGQEHMLYNVGDIYATSATDNASEAYGENSYSVDTWATFLYSWTSNESVFGAAAGQTVNFANTKLILRAERTSQGILLNTDYAVRNMVTVDGVHADTNYISGNISAAVTEVPFLKVILSSPDPKIATVRIVEDVNKNTTPGNTSLAQGLQITQGQVNNVAKALRRISYNNIKLKEDGIAAGSASEQNQWQVFFTPYARFSNNTSYSYSGETVGMTAGASYQASADLSLGMHVDFAASSLEADIMDMHSKSSSIAFGLHGTYDILPNWYVTGQVSVALNQTDNNYYIHEGAGFGADNTVYGNAFYASLASGYVIKFSEGHTLTPEVGISYLGMSMGEFDVLWENAFESLYNMHYDESYYSAWYGTLNLTWNSLWTLSEDASLGLELGLGLRQNLSGNSLETSFRTIGNSYTTTSTEDSSTWLANAGLTYTKNDFSISLNYEGDYGVKQSVHGGSVLVRFDF